MDSPAWFAPGQAWRPNRGRSALRWLKVRVVAYETSGNDDVHAQNITTGDARETTTGLPRLVIAETAPYFRLGVLRHLGTQIM